MVSAIAPSRPLRSPSHLSSSASPSKPPSRFLSMPPHPTHPLPLAALPPPTPSLFLFHRLSIVPSNLSDPRALTPLRHHQLLLFLFFAHAPPVCLESVASANLSRCSLSSTISRRIVVESMS